MEEQMRQIAREEYQKLGTRFGIPQTPRHKHDGVGSPRLDPTSLVNVAVLSPQTGGVLNGVTVTNFNSSTPVAVFPVPILSTTSPSGTATEGTLVIVNNVGAYKLWGYAGGTWRDLTKT